MNQTAKKLTSLLLLSLFFSSLSFPLPTSAQTLDTLNNSVYLPLVTKTGPPSYEILSNYSVIDFSYTTDIYLVGEVANHTSSDANITITAKAYDPEGSYVNKFSIQVYTPANDQTCFGIFANSPLPYVIDHFEWEPLVGIPTNDPWEYSLSSAMSVIESQIITEAEFENENVFYISGKVKNLSSLSYSYIRPLLTIYGVTGEVINCVGGYTIEDVAPEQISVFSSRSFWVMKILEPITYRIQWLGSID